jgi:hypothetical protein
MNPEPSLKAIELSFSPKSWSSEAEILTTIAATDQYSQDLVRVEFTHAQANYAIPCQTQVLDFL